MIVKNYDEFLAAKRTLDRVHEKFLDNESTNDTLKSLEDGLVHLKKFSTSHIVPLQEGIEGIVTLLSHFTAIKKIAMLLNLNRGV